MRAMSVLADPHAPASPVRDEHATSGPSGLPRTWSGGHLGQFDSYRVIACAAVVLQHSFLWTLLAGNVAGWVFVMLLHFSRTAFFFLTALVLAYTQLTRPRSTLDFWRHRYVQLGVPYLIWTGIYWVYTLVGQGTSWGNAGSLLWHDLVYGYYQLYFVVVLFQLYLVFPWLFRFLRARRHHWTIMAGSAAFALLLATDLHWPSAFGAVGHASVWIERYWPWSRELITYQEQFVAGILVALNLEQVSRFVARWYRMIIIGALAAGAGAALWYLGLVWSGSGTGRASDLYQPVAFLWFSAAVAGLECATWWWYRRTLAGHPPRFRALSAPYLASLTAGVYLSHVLFINLARSALKDTGIAPHLGWGGEVAVLFALTLGISAAFTALMLRTPFRRALGAPVRVRTARPGVPTLVSS
jgi:peptidoglycan/LPS O-acetylase OafA/YrhL